MNLHLSTTLAVLLVGSAGIESANAQAPQPPTKTNATSTTPVRVPGTRVSLPPPSGFVPADRFSGFMKESTASSIMVTEMPGPYTEVTAGLDDKRLLEARGMTLLDHSSVEVDRRRGMLLSVEQSAYGTLFRKWMLAIDRTGGTTLIVASFPKAEEKQGEELKAAILAVKLGKPNDPVDALAFTANPAPPFEVAKVMGQNLILSPNGEFPVKDENVPFMVFGVSASEDLTISDQKAFAERRVAKTATVEDITVEQSVPITIGPLSGYATTAKGFGDDTATPLRIYQVLLFDQSGYSLIQGVTPTAEKETYIPIFERMAKTFRLKESQNEAFDSDKD